MLDWIRQIGGVTKHISFSGGEQFLEKNLLIDAIDKAHKEGLHVEIQTSGYWARTVKKGTEFLEQFPRFEQLAVSYDRFHEQFLPVDTIKNAVKAGGVVGIKNVVVRGVHVGHSKKARRTNILFLRKQFNGLGDKVSFLSIPLDIGGRAARSDRKDLYYKAAGRLPSRNYCTAYQSLFIDSQGFVYPCCKSLSSLPDKEDVSIGNLRYDDLETILKKAACLPIPNILRKSGPQTFVKWMDKCGERGLTGDLKTNLMCNDVCGLCFKLFGNKKYVEAIGRMGDIMTPFNKLKSRQLYGKT
jgi:MoaA/NifB/PqqE/SkfB family radical SAM enzyme